MYVKAIPLIVQSGQGSIRRLPTHRNAGLEIVFLERGHLRWQVEDREELVAPGSIFFTLPWQKHGSLEEFEPGHRWYFIVLRLDHPKSSPPRTFLFPPQLGFSLAENRQIARELCAAPRHVCAASPILAVILPELLRQQNPGRICSEQRINKLTSIVVLELATAVRAARSTPPGNRPEHRIAAFQRELAQRSAQHWTLESMAARCGLGRSRFADLLKRQTGDSPVGLLRRLRVANARRLLTTTHLSITEIAQMCGFSTSQYFAEVFRTFTGQSAQGYRHDAANLLRKSHDRK